MKKTFSVLLALMMVFVMCIPAFAAEKPVDPTDEAAWTAYYTELLSDEETALADIAATIVADVTSGAVDKTTALIAVEDAALAVGTDRAYEVAGAVFELLGVTDTPGIPDILPDDNYLPSFFEKIIDAILGFIGWLAGMLFG